MIGFLKGKIVAKTKEAVILDTGGVGYEVILSDRTLENLEQGKETSLFIFTHWSEEIKLFGFETIEEREIFKRLISVSGVGPKSALSIISISEISDLEKAILNSDISYFRRASGIGEKTARKIIFELSGNLEFLSKASFQQDEFFPAMKSLGFSDTEIVELEKKIDGNLSLEDKIKEALKKRGF